MSHAPTPKPHEDDYSNGSSFESYVLAQQHLFEGLELDGEARIPSWQWKDWRESQGAALPSYLGSTEPERYRTLSYDKIATMRGGWKLHLNFDTEDTPKTTTVRAFLTPLENHGFINTYKVGHGGGKAEGAPGKESTVWIGHHDKAVVVAQMIEEALTDVLDAPEGDVLHHDMAFTPRVWGRFTVSRVDPEFHQYGLHGLPFLMREYGKGAMDGGESNRANQVLIQRYGAFYTGTA